MCRPPVDLTQLAARADPSGLQDAGLLAQNEAMLNSGMPSHEELVARVFELEQTLRNNDAAHLAELAALAERLTRLEAMPHNQWKPNGTQFIR